MSEIFESDFYKNLNQMDIESLKHLNSTVVDIIKRKYNEKTIDKIKTFKIKDEVRFYNKDYWVYGEIDKINRKTVVIKQKDRPVAISWRVPASLVEHI